MSAAATKPATASDIKWTLELLEEERRELVALSLVLVTRLQEKESADESESVELTLARILDEKICSTRILQHVETTMNRVRVP